MVGHYSLRSREQLSGSQNTTHARPVSPNWDSPPDALCSSPSMSIILVRLCFTSSPPIPCCDLQIGLPCGVTVTYRTEES